MSRFEFKPNRAQSLLELELNGPRLRLRTTVPDDAQEIFEEFNERITAYMIPRPAEKLEETLEFIDRSRERAKEGSNVQLTIETAIGEFLGCCGLHGEERVRTPELGIWLKEGAQGQGYGKEAIKTLCDWAFENLILDHIVYPVDRRNTASRKIPESLRATVVGEKRMTGFGGNELDLVLYRIDCPVSKQA